MKLNFEPPKADAQTSSGAIASTSIIAASCSFDGTTRHLVPSQRSISGSLLDQPTAQTLSDAEALTAKSTVPRFGLCTMENAVPSQCSVSGPPGPPPFWISPTTHTSL